MLIIIKTFATMFVYVHFLHTYNKTHVLKFMPIKTTPPETNNKKMIIKLSARANQNNTIIILLFN